MRDYMTPPPPVELLQGPNVTRLPPMSDVYTKLAQLHRDGPLNAAVMDYPSMRADLQVPLRPYEPDARLLWVLHRGLIAALGSDGWTRVEASLPHSPDKIKDFAGGAVGGIAAAVMEVAKENVEAIREGIGRVIDFYVAVADVELWIELLKVWTSAPGTEIQAFDEYLRASHPNLLVAFSGYLEFTKKLDLLLRPLLSTEISPGREFSPALEAAADWLENMPLLLGAALRPQVDALVSAKGKPAAQGKIVGQVAARCIIEATVLGMNLFALIGGVVGVGRKLLSATRLALPVQEAGKIAAHADKVAGGVVAAGKAIDKAASEAMRIYQELAELIAPYKQLNKKTGAFNRSVRDICGLKLADVEYSGIRLDAQHIIEATWYDKFGIEMRTAFNWQSKADMDAIALHTEWHIRAGARLRADFNLHGAEKEKSLTTALQGYLKKKQTAPDGAAAPFKSLREVFDAHEAFYKEYSPRLYAKLESWFEQRRQSLPP